MWSSGSGATVRPCSCEDEAQLEEAVAEPAELLGQRDPEQVRLRELGPGLAVEPVLAVVELAQVRERHAVAQDLLGQALELLLLFGEGEVHESSLPPTGVSRAC